MVVGRQINILAKYTEYWCDKKNIIKLLRKNKVIYILGHKQLVTTMPKQKYR